MLSSPSERCRYAIKEQWAIFSTEYYKNRNQLPGLQEDVYDEVFAAGSAGGRRAVRARCGAEQRSAVADRDAHRFRSGSGAQRHDTVRFRNRVFEVNSTKYSRVGKSHHLRPFSGLFRPGWHTGARRAPCRAPSGAGSMTNCRSSPTWRRILIRTTTARAKGDRRPSLTARDSFRFNCKIIFEI